MELFIPSAKKAPGLFRERGALMVELVGVLFQVETDFAVPLPQFKGVDLQPQQLQEDPFQDLSGVRV